jgi:hypothetical protein
MSWQWQDFERPQTGRAYLEQVYGVHDSVFLLIRILARVRLGTPMADLPTAMPANAPAAMLAAKEKFGGSDS